MASWSSNPTCHYLKAIYRAPFWGSPGWVECSRLQGWGWSIFPKKSDGVNKLWGFGFFRFGFGFFLERPFDENIFPAWSTYNVNLHWNAHQPAWMMLCTGGGRWSLAWLSPSNDVVTSPLIEATGCIFGYVHPLPWRYVPYQEGIICNQSSSKRDHCTYRNTRPAIQRSVLRVLSGTIQAPMRKVAEGWQPLAVGFNGRIVLPLADCFLCIHRDVWRIEVHILY